jgi:hypothetical protein
MPAVQDCALLEVSLLDFAWVSWMSMVVQAVSGRLPYSLPVIRSECLRAKRNHLKENEVMESLYRSVLTGALVT